MSERFLSISTLTVSKVSIPSFSLIFFSIIFSGTISCPFFSLPVIVIQLLLSLSLWKIIRVSFFSLIFFFLLQGSFPFVAEHAHTFSFLVL